MDVFLQLELDRCTWMEAFPKVHEATFDIFLQEACMGKMNNARDRHLLLQ